MSVPNRPHWVHLTAQAKGRVERANGTLQDRLVKALRLAGISTIEAANEFLERQFLREHNRRFAKKAAEPTDAHRCLPPGLALSEVLCVQETRTVGRDWCIRYANRVLQLAKRHEKLSLAGRTVTVRELASGQLQVVYKGQRLRWSESPASAAPAAPPAQAAGNAVAGGLKSKAPRPVSKPRHPSPDHPWRRPALVKAASLRSSSLRSSSLLSAALTSPGG